MCVRVCGCEPVCVSVCACVCMCVYEFVYVSVCVCLCVSEFQCEFVHRPAERIVGPALGRSILKWASAWLPFSFRMAFIDPGKKP